MGAAIGASLAGYKPVAEIMRMNFTAVAMDMSAAYRQAVSAHLKGATIVFDHFHVIKLYNNELSQGFRGHEFFKLKILAIHETKYALVESASAHCRTSTCVGATAARARSGRA